MLIAMDNEIKREWKLGNGDNYRGTAGAGERKGFDR